MFTELAGTDPKVLALKITGSLSKQQAAAMSDLIRTRASEQGPLRLLLFISHYPSLNSAEDLYFDLDFAVRNAKHIERMAVVADRAWKRTWVALFKLFSGLKTAFFREEEYEEAADWTARA